MSLDTSQIQLPCLLAPIVPAVDVQQHILKFEDVLVHDRPILNRHGLWRSELLDGGPSIQNKGDKIGLLPNLSPNGCCVHLVEKNRLSHSFLHLLFRVVVASPLPRRPIRRKKSYHELLW